MRIVRIKKGKPSDSVDGRIARSKMSKESVITVIRMINAAEQRFSNNPRNYMYYKIHRNPNNKHFKIFLGIYNYIKELCNGKANPIEYVLEDYITSIYERYANWEKIPWLSQLASSPSNRMLFDDWIRKWENDNQENYFVDGNRIDLSDIISKARKSIDKTNNSHHSLDKFVRVDVV